MALPRLSATLIPSRVLQNASYGTWHHDDFYDDAVVREWYQNYVKTLVTRVNTITGVAYASDPTIFAWQLANEPRCGGTGGAPRSSKCVTKAADGTPRTLLTEWARDMSAFIKGLDPNHMVSVGDEGFMCEATPSGAPASLFDCSDGGDNVGYASIDSIRRVCV